MCILCNSVCTLYARHLVTLRMRMAMYICHDILLLLYMLQMYVVPPGYFAAKAYKEDEYFDEEEMD